MIRFIHVEYLNQYTSREDFKYDKVLTPQLSFDIKVPIFMVVMPEREYQSNSRLSIISLNLQWVWHDLMSEFIHHEDESFWPMFILKVDTYKSLDRHTRAALEPFGTKNYLMAVIEHNHVSKPYVHVYDTKKCDLFKKQNRKSGNVMYQDSEIKVHMMKYMLRESRPLLNNKAVTTLKLEAIKEINGKGLDFLVRQPENVQMIVLTCN